MATINWTTSTSGVWSPTVATPWTPAAVPTAADNVIIDPVGVTQSYTVTVAAGTSVTADTLALNTTNAHVNQASPEGAVLQMNGTLTLNATAGAITGALQSVLLTTGGTFINAGTVAPFIQGTGTVLFTGTNSLYVQNELQSTGVVIVDQPIAEMVANTLTDGIFDASGPGNSIDLGGATPAGGTGPVIVNIATVQGPADQHATIGFHGWTELTFNGPGTQINEYNGTAYASVETSLTTIGAYGIVDEEHGRGYTTAKALTINNAGIFNADGGAIAINGGLAIASGGVFEGSGTISNAVANNGTISALAGPTEAGVANTNLTIAGAITGTGAINFDIDYKPVIQFQQAATVNTTTPASLTVGSVSAGQTVNMNANDTLNLTTPAAFQGTINGAVGDRIVLTGLTAGAATVSGNHLVVTNGGAAFATLNIGSSLTSDTFLVTGNTLYVAAPGTPPSTPVPTPGGTPTSTPTGTPIAGFAGFDTTNNTAVTTGTSAYSGPVAGVTSQFVSTTADSLNINVTSPNWFIHTGSGNDAIQVSSGTNVLDGSTGSNFLTGGSGSDTFFVDDRSAPSDIWSTMSNFHSGDAATIFGVTQGAFNLQWADNEGATGFTGLTLHAIASGQPIASMTLVGYTTADLTNGRLTVSFGTTDASGGVAGSSYMYVKAN